MTLTPPTAWELKGEAHDEAVARLGACPATLDGRHDFDHLDRCEECGARVDH